MSRNIRVSRKVLFFIVIFTVALSSCLQVLAEENSGPASQQETRQPLTEAQILENLKNAAAKFGVDISGLSVADVRAKIRAAVEALNQK